MRKSILLILLAIISINGSAQNKKKPWDGKTNYGYFNTLELYLSQGSFIKNSNQLNDNMDNPYTDFALRIGIQSTGKHLWEQILAYPIYGMGFYNAYFYEEEPLGLPGAIYFFINAPIKRWNKFSIKWELATGLAYDFNRYDFYENPRNNVIGSSENVYFHGKIFAEFELNKRWDLGVGAGVNHFSNGSTQTPNLGINLANITINLRYNFNPVKAFTKKIDPDYQPPIRPKFVPKNIPKTIRHHEFNLYYSAGGKATTREYTNGPIYFISSFTADYHYKYYHIAKIGAGIDYFYEAARRLQWNHPTYRGLEVIWKN